VQDASRISFVDPLSIFSKDYLETSINQNAPFTAGFLEVILNFISARMLLFWQSFWT